MRCLGVRCRGEGEEEEELRISDVPHAARVLVPERTLTGIGRCRREATLNFAANVRYH